MVGAGRTPSPLRAPAVLIVVQNLPVPFDRRVWLECKALTAAGYKVSVVCPRGPGDPAEEEIDGVSLYKYRAPRTGTGKAAFVREYLYSFVATACLVVKVRLRGRFAVLQACNPPDIFWPLALALRPFGVKFVFDHHDLCPELYLSKFGGGRRVEDRFVGSPFVGDRSLPYRGLLLLERATFRSAHHVISTNDSYREIALARGGRRPDEVTVVRTGPDAGRMARRAARAGLRQGRRYLCVYLGVMGVQDGVDLAVRAADHLVHTMGRADVSFVFVGAGEARDELLTLRDRLGLGGFVDFPGRLPDDDLADLLSTADVGLCPDPKNPLNDLSTMNKTMEYMSYGLPVVSFDLHETRVSAASAATYVTPNDVCAFASEIAALLDDEPRRRRMGLEGRRRVMDVLAWSHQAPRYVGVYDALTGSRRSPEVPEAAEVSEVPEAPETAAPLWAAS